jgi:glycosyltransferase involved in cell wall biosynthesis
VTAEVQNTGAAETRPCSPRRILHVVNQVNDRGDGIANVCVDLACEQAAIGYTVALASASGGFVGLVQENRVEHHEVDFAGHSVIGMAKAATELRRIARGFAPDIVHAHTMRAALAARTACIGTGVPVVATVHNEYQRGVILMGSANVVVGVSSAVSAAMARRGISRRRIRTVRNGITGSVRRRTAELRDSPKLAERAIVAVGAVSKRKGADTLLDAFDIIADRLPTAELYFVGNIDWTELVDRARTSPHRDRVHFTGFDPQPQRYLQAGTVFALASRRDPFPLALLEALEAGIPVVATNIDGVPEALDGGRAGLLVARESPAELAAAITDVLESDTRRTELAAASRARSSHFSVSLMTNEYLAIYAEIGGWTS